MNALPLRFGRYEVLARLGSGGFAQVYRARDPLLAREVAVKVLRDDFADVGHNRERFLSEARVLAALRQPNIVAVFDVGVEGALPYFVMELLDGETLAQRLQRDGVFSLATAAPILTALAAAIDALHAAGLVHRDITAANVMLTREGHVVLMDFGIALIEGGSRLTRGYGLGTPESAAPEQIRNEAVGPAADIYALGVLVYALLSGSPPFAGDTAHVLYAHAHLSPPSLRVHLPQLPAGVDAAVAAMLAKDPADRPASARAAIAALTGEPRPVATLPGAPQAGADVDEPGTLDAPLHFAGEGSTRADIALHAGLLTLSFACDDGAQLDARLSAAGVLLLHAGPLRGPDQGVRAATVMQESAGLLDVVALGRWRCAVEQPDVRRQRGVQRAEGRGDAVLYLQLDAGVRRVKLTHNVWRTGRFRASLYAPDAVQLDTLAVSSGSYSGAPSRRIVESGVQALVIEAAGAWTVEVA